MESAPTRIAIIGFGEAGSILGADLARSGNDVVTYDILMDSPATRAAMLARARDAHVRHAGSLAECVTRAELIISAVTATASGEVAQACARSLEPAQFYLDINSVAPATKRANAAAAGSSAPVMSRPRPMIMRQQMLTSAS